MTSSETHCVLADSVVRRSCSCADKSHEHACPACQRKRQAVLDQARSLVAEGGQSLDPDVREWAQQRFGASFGDVRVHADARAAASAQALQAKAYALGSHIVFNQGAYAPASRSGRHLLAHELAHVMQHGDAVKRKSLSPPSRVELGGADDREEREADAAAETVMQDDDDAPAGRAALSMSSGRPALRRAPLDDPAELAWPEKEEAECIKRVPPDPVECDPSRQLTWNDFARRNSQSSFSAKTASDFRRRTMNTAALLCSPAERTRGVAGEGLQAFMDPAKSWVKPVFADPNIRCNARIAECKRAFSQPNTAWQRMDPGPVAGCAASVRARGDKATSADECETVFGADCRDTTSAESARLLRHEQGHFDIACAMARKANVMHRVGNDFDALLRATRTATNRAQNSYDRQTRHGCNASAQSDWESEIAKGLQAHPITLPGRRGRR